LTCLLCGCGRSEAESIPVDPGRIRSVSAVGDVDAAFTEADVRCNTRGPANEGSLICHVYVSCKTDEPRILHLKKCWLSYDAESLGHEITVSLNNRPPIDQIGFPPRGNLASWNVIQGWGLLAHEYMDKYVWITLALSVDGTSFMIRKATRVRNLM
jgi:hypothetical protein